MARIDPTEPFIRISHPSLEMRRTTTKDPRLLAARAGYLEHTKRSDVFWKSTVVGKEEEEVCRPVYSQEKFCKGFNITALDFYVLRYRLCSLLYRKCLWLKKQKEER